MNYKNFNLYCSEVIRELTFRTLARCQLPLMMNLFHWLSQNIFLHLHPKGSKDRKKQPLNTTAFAPDVSIKHSLQKTEQVTVRILTIPWTLKDGKETSVSLFTHWASSPVPVFCPSPYKSCSYPEFMHQSLSSKSACFTRFPKAVTFAALKSCTKPEVVKGFFGEMCAAQDLEEQQAT